MDIGRVLLYLSVFSLTVLFLVGQPLYTVLGAFVLTAGVLGTRYGMWSGMLSFRDHPGPLLLAGFLFFLLLASNTALGYPVRVAVTDHAFLVGIIHGFSAFLNGLLTGILALLLMVTIPYLVLRIVPWPPRIADLLIAVLFTNGDAGTAYARLQAARTFEELVEHRTRITR